MCDGPLDVPCGEQPARLLVCGDNTGDHTAPIAFAGGQGDRFGGFLANPDGFLQGHAVWHTLGAVAILAAYEVFATTGFDRSTLRHRSEAAPLLALRSS
jgi:hypothetical protein